MSTKNLFLTHDGYNVGKKSNNLLMAGGTRNQNSGFLCMTDTSGAQR